MNVFSFGGGVQSTAALVLAARGDLDCDAFLFANVGDDSEHPATLRYVREVAMPYAAAHSIELHELHRQRKDGSIETLYGRLTRPGSKSIGIPVRLAGSGAPAQRNCTADFKIRVIASWCYRHGARKMKPATTMLGISMDEFQRMRTDSGISYTRLAYPLIDRRMSRQDCINVIASAGLPVPPKSSCWFCPYHRLSVWQRMRDEEPDLFRKACELEASLTARAKTLKRYSPKALPPEQEAVFFTRTMKPLAQAVGNASQLSLFDSFEGDVCESGFCVA
ncbi:MAG: hypothetical protein OJF49_003200 [Ktedonobacterales bacterium]|jgi:hypothetical protein|nr:MAG: hypothetical protein OJF49_003200 [Ktedonobacterales bacterium]